MSDPIPLMLSTSFYRPVDGPTQATILPVGAVFGNSAWGDGFKGDSPLFGAWVIDRSQPNNPLVYKTNWTDNNEVPEGLRPYLTDAYILLFGFAGWITSAPAGDLYRTLIENGAGAELRKLQSMSTALACGVSGLWMYSLITTPGTGTPGVDVSHMARSNSGQTTGSPPYASVYSIAAYAYDLTVQLVSGTDGKYNPVRFA
ncbi:MAG: hypothetical protein R6X02_32820 [Enhygromyxa sp.]